MKALLIGTLTALIIIGTLYAKVEGEFKKVYTPKLGIDQEAFIEEAKGYLKRERPEIDPEKLLFTSLDYRFNYQEEQIGVEGPNGIEIVQQSPFAEKLTVSFVILDSARELKKGDRKVIEKDGISVVFPTPSKEGWDIEPFYQTSYP